MIPLQSRHKGETSPQSIATDKRKTCWQQPGTSQNTDLHFKRSSEGAVWGGHQTTRGQTQADGGHGRGSSGRVFTPCLNVSLPLTNAFILPSIIYLWIHQKKTQVHWLWPREIHHLRGRHKLELSLPFLLFLPPLLPISLSHKINNKKIVLNMHVGVFCVSTCR